MSEPRSAVAVLALGLALAACAGTPTAATRAAGAGRSGDERLRLGDYDGAAREFEGEIAAGDASPTTRENLATARHRAASTHASAAVRAADADDLDRARAELARADSFGPDVVAVRDAHAVLDARIASVDKATQLRDRARALVATRPDEADRLLAEADTLAPGATENLRREATSRAAAERSLAAAVEAWGRRDRARTVADLAGASFGGRPVAGAAPLRRRIEQDLVAETSPKEEAALRSAAEFAADARLDASVVRLLQDRLVERLVSAARDLRETHRPATAALLEIEARRLRGDVKTPALAEALETATPTVVVEPFVDETDGRFDGSLISRALRERLRLDTESGGAPLRAVDAADAPAPTSESRVLRLSGRVLAARTSDGRVGRENHKVPYRSGTARQANPEYEDLTAQLRAAAQDLTDAESEQRGAAAEVDSARAQSLSPARDTSRPNEITTTTRLAAAQSRLDAADLALKRAKETHAAVRARLQGTPREVDVPVWAEHLLVVTTKLKTSQVTAHFELTSGGEALLSQDATAAVDHRETIADGFAPARIPPDADATPDDAEMAAKAADRFAAVTVGSIRAACEKAALRRLADARDAAAAGRRDEASENYALYLLATSDVFSPERAEAARGLAELSGVHVALRTAKKDRP